MVLFVFGLQADEFYFDITNYKIDRVSESKKYCKALQKGIDHRICFSKSLHYDLMQNDKLLKGFNEDISYLKKEYDKTNIDGYLTPQYLPATDMYANYDLKLISVTPYSYTIQENISSYTGGVHGMFETVYHNYTRDGKALVLDAMIRKGKQDAFTKIAKKVYLEQDKDGLDDWIESKFFVPDNFVVTTEGLIFLYNPYEAKAYAFGQTSFIVPFDRLHGIIKGQYIVHNASTQRWFYDKNIGSIHLSYHRQKDGVKLDVDYEAIAPNQDTYVSFSFPYMTKTEAIKVLHYDGAKSFKIYPVGSDIFALDSKQKRIKSHYLLLEAHGKYMHQGHFSFVVKKEHFVMLMRMALASGSHFLSMPSFSKKQDQQGFDCFVFKI